MIESKSDGIRGIIAFNPRRTVNESNMYMNVKLCTCNTIHLLFEINVLVVRVRQVKRKMNSRAVINIYRVDFY